jgi:succinoglycan biosynthesis protein ExoM
MITVGRYGGTIPSGVCEDTVQSPRGGNVNRNSMLTRLPGYSVCITTARRNQFLRDLLVSLEQQAWLPPPGALEVVVVDNNPDGSAKAVVDAFANERWPLRYFHCGIPSIPVARNAAVEAARHQEVVLIDDDQLMPPELLRRLDEAWRGQPAAAAGLFHRRLQFEPGVSVWARRGGVDPPLAYSHGSILPPSHGHTGGVVVRRSVFDRVRFDEKWGLLGCDDNAFFKAVGAQGLSVVYLREVEIVERIQASRATFGALMAQGFHQGLCYAHVELGTPNPARVGGFVARAVAALGLYTVALPFAMLMRPFGSLRPLKMVVRQIGKIVGVFGFSYDYYSK